MCNGFKCSQGCLCVILMFMECNYNVYGVDSTCTLSPYFAYLYKHTLLLHINTNQSLISYESIKQY